MITAKSVLLTTSPSKDGIQFPVSTLETALELSSITGLTSCLGHDSTRPIGWTIPSTLYFEPGITRLAGQTFIAETSEEQAKISNLHLNALAVRSQRECLPYKELFEKELKGHLSENFKMVSSTFVSCYDEGIIDRYYSNIMSKRDKDGLVYLRDLLDSFEYMGQGVFKDKSSKFAICAHAYFRKSLSLYNNLNYFFLDQLLKYAGDKDVTLRLKLDTNLIGIAETFVPAMEFEYWRGPRFNNDVAKIKLGVTEHKMDEYNKIFNGIDRTEFIWKIEGGKQTFEAEEVKNNPSLGVSNEDYGCRYAHSIYNTDNNTFEHFDGAIRMYDTEKMLERLDNDIKSAGKQSLYTKLFRIDGQLPLADWKLLLHHYFQGNHLIEEYLEGECKDDRHEIKFVEDEPLSIDQMLIPVTLGYDDGFRMAVSYLKVDKTVNEISTHNLLGHDTIDTVASNVEKKIIEVDILEIKKSLLKQGYKLHIPDDYKLVDCYDGLHWNIPKIVLQNDGNLSNYIAALFQAVVSILVAQDHPEKTVSFTFAWQEKNLDRQTVVSLLGTSKVLIDWFNKYPTIPIENKKFRDWLDSVGKWLDSFPTSNDNPRLTDILYDDGTLYIKREPVLKYAMINTDKREGVNISIQLKDEFRELADVIESNNIYYSPLFQIQEITCQECGMEYARCQHSSCLDGTKTNVSNFTLLGYYWIKAH
ncbi:hypothetical protein SAMN05444266_108322 [Chitinophaga jiangningensis]|uniref:Uncharacterized protein n=1 Tax=Chitinophaga jiangningensis TaxID=1419482 RepID=A0A1M7JDI1_9BACT|nr:hypothetical protein [Chitinophaga jiangningensis]SHM51036.1 hypothetical protein SAMN05444266_108322 [Chitinophaga jiangningensis]